MNKIAVGKTLLKGSPKQRALLLANHLSESNLGGKGFLSPSEVNSLVDSFKTDSEIKIYNLYKRRFTLVGAYLSNLSQARLSYKEGLERLEKFLLLRMNNDDFEDAVNNLLSLISDKKTKAKGLRVMKSFSRLALYREVNPDESGLVRIDDNRLKEIIEQLRKRVSQEQVSLKTSIQAIKDYFDSSGFNVKVFKAFVKEIENWAKSDKGMNLIFTTALENGPFSVEDGEPHGLHRLREKHTLEEKYERVQIDKEVYDRLLRDELNE